MNFEQIFNNISQQYYPLTEECIFELVENAAIVSTDKNEVLVKEGQFVRKIFFIVEGVARAYYLKDGKDISDWFAFEGDFICSLNSFFHNGPSLHYIETLEPSVLLVLTQDKFIELSNKHLSFERAEKAVITETMLKLQQRIVSMQFETAHQKYENLIKTRPDITLRVPLMHIASYLGITLETLSRIRSNKRRI